MFISSLQYRLQCSVWPLSMWFVALRPVDMPYNLQRLKFWQDSCSLRSRNMWFRKDIFHVFHVRFFIWNMKSKMAIFHMKYEKWNFMLTTLVPITRACVFCELSCTGKCRAGNSKGRRPLPDSDRGRRRNGRQNLTPLPVQLYKICTISGKWRFWGGWKGTLAVSDWAEILTIVSLAKGQHT